MKTHNFVRSKGEDKYNDIVFCTKCGLVAWTFLKQPEWNKENLQSKLPEECNRKS